MIPNQRHLFDLPDDHAYLNCAYTGPAAQGGRPSRNEAIEAKRTPWKIKADDFFSSVETLRRLFGHLLAVRRRCRRSCRVLRHRVGGEKPSGERDQSIVVLQDQFPSNVYSWMNLAARM